MKIKQYKNTIEIDSLVENVAAMDIKYQGTFKADFKHNGIVRMNRNRIVILFLTNPDNGVLFEYEGFLKFNKIDYYTRDYVKKMPTGYKINEDTWEKQLSSWEGLSNEYEKLDLILKEKKYDISEIKYTYQDSETNPDNKTFTTDSNPKKNKKRKLSSRKATNLLRDSGVTSYNHNHTHIYIVDKNGDGVAKSYNGHSHKIVNYQIEEVNSHIHEIEVKQNGIK